jgi:hypothetical protein
MTDASDIAACKNVVAGYCAAINEWERMRSILGRLENNQFVSASQRESVKGLTLEAHDQEHMKIFDRFIVPRVRRYGSNPGNPNSWSDKGSFFDVSPQTIRSVEFPACDRAEVVTDWGFQLPGGTTMFVLKRAHGTWRIDSLKIGSDDGWDVAHL